MNALNTPVLNFKFLILSWPANPGFSNLKLKIKH